MNQAWDHMQRAPQGARISSDCSDLITSVAEDVKQQRLPDQRACS